MGDGINIDFGQLQQPNIVGGMMQSYQAGRQMGIEQRADNALARVQANPSDPAALSDLAVYNPQAANAFLTMAQNQRLTAARAASAGVYSSYAANQPGASPAPMAAPAPAPSPLTAPTLPAQPNVAPPGPAAAPAPQGAPATPQAPAQGQSQGVPVAQLLSPAHPVTQQVGAAVANGQLSMPAAVAQLAQYADPAEVQQVLANLSTMDTMRKAKLQEANGALATAAQSVLSIPDDPTHSARRQAAMAMLPQLQAHGVTPDMIQNADMSDAGLHGLIGQAVGVEGLIAQSNKTAELTETHRHNVADENKPISVPFGNMLQRPDGTVINDGMGTGAGGGATALTGNNPGGIIDGTFAKSQPGYTGANGKFAGFDTLAHGAAAQTALLQSYVSNGIDTPAKIATKWAPAGDGANNPQVYAANVAKAMGIGVNDKITPAMIPAFQQAQAQQENSMYKPPVAGAGGMRAALQTQAAQIAAYNMPPPTGRAATSAQGVALMQMVGTLNPDYDATKYHEKNQAAAAFGAGKLGSQVRSISVAVDHLDLLGQAATALQNGNVQAFNSLGNSIAAATGNPAPTNFNALKQYVMDETAKAIIGGGGGVGDRDKAGAIISQAQSPQQLSGAIQQVQGLMGGQLQGLKRQYQDATGNTDFENKVSPRAAQVLGMHGQTSGPVRVSSPQEAQALPSGTLFQTPDGRVIRKH